MTRRNLLIILATIGSAALLLGAWGFQYLGGLAPCKMCIWQRYPHGAAVVIGAMAIGIPSFRFLPALGALAAMTTTAIGVFHTGVERGWWEGPSSCTSGSIHGLTTEELMEQIMAAPLVRCDEVPWEMFELSMASWNAVVSLALALIWIVAWRSE